MTAIEPCTIEISNSCTNGGSGNEDGADESRVVYEDGADERRVIFDIYHPSSCECEEECKSSSECDDCEEEDGADENDQKDGEVRGGGRRLIFAINHPSSCECSHCSSSCEEDGADDGKDREIRRWFVEGSNKSEVAKLIAGIAVNENGFEDGK